MGGFTPTPALLLPKPSPRAEQITVDTVWTWQNIYPSFQRLPQVFGVQNFTCPWACVDSHSICE